MNNQYKFCTSCQAHRKIEGGKTKAGRFRTRWVCVECAKASERREPTVIATFAPKKLEPLWRNP